ncbi:MAG TPA: 50S ribosomal protein L25 [Anaerolineales bacterium]
MEKVVLQATKREISGKQVRALRRTGQLPAVIYGRHLEPISISLEAHGATLALAKLTSSSLITISVEGKEYPTLVREKQRNYIKGDLLHIDFLAVDLKENIRARVGIEITGTSLAVKDLNAVLVHGLTQLEVECLPTDLPERVVVDISGLVQIGNGIHVRDIAISDKVRVLDDPDEMVVVATYAKEEEIEEPVVAEVAVAETAEPELSVDRGKKEEGEVEDDKDKDKDKDKKEKKEKK